MRWATIMLAACSLVVGAAGAASAQSEETRPATTTFWGDTGLWFVPTGETLPSGQGSLSVQRAEFNFRQGNTNATFWPVTAAFGAGPVDIFGSLRVVTRMYRQTSPLLADAPAHETAGIVNDFPTLNERWTGTHLGDLYVGGKLNLMSQRRDHPMALALRGTMKVPTADETYGIGTGKYDWFADLIGSKALRSVEFTGFSGIVMRQDMDNLKIADGTRWGGGAAFPARGSLRFTTEMYGEWLWDNAITAPAGQVVGRDGSPSPVQSDLRSEYNAAAGLTYQHSSGVLLGAGVNYKFYVHAEDAGLNGVSTGNDGFGFQVRLGFHPGVKAYVRPEPIAALAPPPPSEPAPAPAPPAPPAPIANRAPTVRIVCDPCSVVEGRSITLRALATDPDGDALNVYWTATGGTIGDTRAASTTWRAETAPGLITLNVRVEDGRGASASDKTTVDVAIGKVDVEDLHFAFDSAKVLASALPLLEPAVAALKANPTLKVTVEGHTCDLGSTDYNQALGERRAAAIRDYFVAQGIAAVRIAIASRGETQPKFENSTKDLRKMNRRAEVMVSLGEDR